MRNRVLLAWVLVWALAAGAAQAQTGGGYDLTHHTYDVGGGTLSGGDFALDGTVGQPEADDVSGGDFEVGGGFWPVPGLFGVAIPAASAVGLALLACLLLAGGLRAAHRRRSLSRG
jgi:hypothetical protein